MCVCVRVCCIHSLGSCNWCCIKLHVIFCVVKVCILMLLLCAEKRITSLYAVILDIHEQYGPKFMTVNFRHCHNKKIYLGVFMKVFIIIVRLLL